LGAGTGFTLGLDVFLLFTAGFFEVDGFFTTEAFFAGADFEAGFKVFLAGADLAFFAGLAVDFFAAGFEAFLADFTEDLLFFTAAGFLDGLAVLFVVFFFVVSFFTTDTSFEN